MSTPLAANGGTCTVTATYGPQTSTVANTNTNLTITYPPNSNAASYPVTAFSVVTINASQTALIQITGVTQSGTLISGSGTSGSPYAFTNMPSNQLTFVTTYTNNGMSAANNFYVNGTNIPTGYVFNAVGSNPCPYSQGSSLSLAANTSCSVSVSVMNPLAQITLYQGAWSSVCNSESAVCTNYYAYNNLPSGLQLNYSLLGYSYCYALC